MSVIIRQAFHIKIIILFTFLCFKGQAQNYHKIDSLLNTLNDTELSGEKKVDNLNALAHAYLYYDQDSTLYFLKKAKILAQSMNYSRGIVINYLYDGRLKANKNNVEEAEKIFNKGVDLALEVEDSLVLMKIYMALGNLNDIRGDYNKALDYYLKTLKINELRNDSTHMAASYLGLGNIYNQINQNNQAISAYFNSYQLYLKTNRYYAGWSANNLGTIYEQIDSLDSAYFFYKESIKIKTEFNDTYGVAFTYANIGKILIKKKKYKKALEYFKKSHQAKLEIESTPEEMGASYLNMANIYSLMEKYDLGQSYFDSAIGVCDTSVIKNVEQEVYQVFSEHYYRQGKYKKAFDAYLISTEIKDELLNEKTQKHIADMKEKYQSEKKELEIQNLQNQKKIQDQELQKEKIERKRQNIIITAFAVGLILMIGLAVVIGLSLQRRKRDNAIIREQKLRVEEKNTEILDSIQYAKRLQDAILPPKKLVKEYFEDSFILFKPKDIVSGDFYWMETHNDHVFFAAADCTGHGVPGAMVSVVCANALNKAVNELNKTNPAEILDATRNLVISTFEKSKDEVKDGMDIALISLKSKQSELESESDASTPLSALTHTQNSHSLCYAGANNPLWIIRKDQDEIEIIKPDKQPIGKYGELLPFTSHEIKLGRGDSIYMFSDGYADQFGGERGKKMKSGKFKKILLDHRNAPMEQQRDALDQAFEEWKGDLEQIDDVCVIGIRV